MSALTDSAFDALARRRGWTRDALTRLGVTEAQDGRLVLPVAGGQPLKYDPFGRKQPKMLAAERQARGLWPDPSSVLGDSDRAVWLVEGEGDAIALASLGLPGVAFPGAEGWKPDMAAVFAGRRVNVICDADAPGRRAANAIADGLLGTTDDVRVIDLDPDRNDGFDLGDQLLEALHDGSRHEHVTRYLTALADTRPPHVPSRFAGTRYTLAELEVAARTPIIWRVGSIAADAHLTMLAGAAGAGKSLMAHAFANAVTRGGIVGGLHCEQGGAAIIDAEQGPLTFGRRCRAVRPHADPAAFTWHDASDWRITDDDVIRHLARIVRRDRATFLVLDSLAALSGAVSENDNAEQTELVSRIRLLARDTGAAVLLLHHRGRDGDKAWRGASAIVDQVDMAFTMSRGDETRRHVRRLRCVKARLGIEPDDVHLALDGGDNHAQWIEADPEDRDDDAWPT